MNLGVKQTWLCHIDLMFYICKVVKKIVRFCEDVKRPNICVKLREQGLAHSKR